MGEGFVEGFGDRVLSSIQNPLATCQFFPKVFKVGKPSEVLIDCHTKKFNSGHGTPV